MCVITIQVNHSNQEFSFLLACSIKPSFFPIHQRKFASGFVRNTETKGARQELIGMSITRLAVGTGTLVLLVLGKRSSPRYTYDERQRVLPPYLTKIGCQTSFRHFAVAYYWHSHPETVDSNESAVISIQDR